MTLTEALKKRKWTQKQLAEKTGYSEQKISMLANGWGASLEEAEKISVTLDFEVDVTDLVSAMDAKRLREWRARTPRKAGAK